MSRENLRAIAVIATFVVAAFGFALLFRPRDPGPNGVISPFTDLPIVFGALAAAIAGRLLSSGK
jgi:hypothetical protein